MYRGRRSQWSGFRLCLAVTAIVLILTIPVLGFFHAIVPHKHTHATTEHQEMKGWFSATTGRKEFIDLSGIAALPNAWFEVALLMAFTVLTLSAYRGLLFVHSLQLALYRGILPYRRFG